MKEEYFTMGIRRSCLKVTVKLEVLVTIYNVESLK